MILSRDCDYCFCIVRFRSIPHSEQAPWHRVQKRLAGVELWPLGSFRAYQWHQGISEAAVGRQRAAGDSRKALDHLLPPGLSKEAHMQQAFSTPSPFHRLDTIDPDLMFACMALRVWGPLLPVWRQRIRRLLHRLISLSSNPVCRV